MKIFCFSGLGVDERVFQGFHCPNIDFVPIPWIEPKKNESIPEYAGRLLNSFELNREDVLLGVSFGGCIAQEIAKKLDSNRLILISSFTKKQQIKFFWRVLLWLRVDQFLPNSLFTKDSFFLRFFFGVRTNDDKILFKAIMKDTNVLFLRWALHALRSKYKMNGLAALKIHGSKDRIISPAKDCVILEGAGHFAAVTHVKEINELIKNSSW